MSKKKTKYKKLKSFLQTSALKKLKKSASSGKVGYFGKHLIFQVRYDGNSIKGYTFENFKREIAANTRSRQRSLERKQRLNFWDQIYSRSHLMCTFQRKMVYLCVSNLINLKNALKRAM